MKLTARDKGGCRQVIHCDWPGVSNKVGCSVIVQMCTTNHLRYAEWFTCELPARRQHRRHLRASFWREPRPIGWETPAGEGRPTPGHAHYQPSSSPRKLQWEPDLHTGNGTWVIDGARFNVPPNTLQKKSEYE